MNRKSFYYALVISLALLLGIEAKAQTSTVGATITDSTGQAFANGNWTATFVKAFGSANPPTRKDTGVQLTAAELTLSGSLDSAGAFAGVVLTRTDYIVPSGGTWKFTICPLATSPCFTYSTTVTTTPLSLSIQLSAASGTIATVAGGDVFRMIPRAYKDNEVSGQAVGSWYYDLTNMLPKWYDNGTWNAVAIGGSILSLKCLNGMCYADQFAGATSGDKILAACTYSGTNAPIIAQFGMASGDPTTLPNGCYVFDYRSGGKNRVFVGTGTGIQEVSSFAINAGGDNPFGKFQVFSEIGTMPNADYPQGHNLNPFALGAADVRIENRPYDITSTTSVGAPGAVSVTVNTTNICTPAKGCSLLIEPDGANQETISFADWSITSGTVILATFTKTHTQPFTIRQIGGTYFDTRTINMNTADASDRPVVFQAAGNTPCVSWPNDTLGTFPLSAVQWNCVQTGANGVNKKLLFKLALSTSAIEVANSAGLGNLWALSESSGAADLKLGNSINQSFRFTAASDNPRIFGGGTAGGITSYGSQGGAGTCGDFRFRNNATDETQVSSITCATGNVNTIGQFVSTKATGTAPLSITSTTPVANLTTVPTTYNTAGTQQTGVHIVIGRCTLGTDCAVTLVGTAVFTSSSSYQCSVTDTTTAAATKFAPASGSSFTLTGTATDVLSYTCVGN